MKIYCGIDIGNSGAISSLRDGEIGETIPMPTTMLAGRKTADRYGITAFIQDEQSIADGEKITVIVEAASTHLQSQKVAASMWFGYMAVIAALQDADVRYVLTPAKKWQAEFGIKKDTKAMSLSVCKTLFPNAALKLTPKSKKENDNISDSILIAEYGRRKNL